jgi:hypothetical protein
MFAVPRLILVLLSGGPRPTGLRIWGPEVRILSGAPVKPGSIPDTYAHLFDTNALASEDNAEIDLAAIEADAAACGHSGGSIVERIIDRHK